MSYPQSGGYGYGQNPQGAQQYGQPADYGQQYAGQYGQQQGYDAQAQAQAQYAQQQYQQQAQYGYGAPQQPANPGLPANTPLILASVIGALGVITLFCGFLAGVEYDTGYGSTSGKLFEAQYNAPYILIAVAGLVALTSFALGFEKWIVGSVLSLTVVGALVTIFVFATNEADNGAGAIILLITAILSAIAAVVWLLVEGGQIKLAEAVATPAAATAATAADASQQYGAQQQAAQQQAAAPAADYGYGYGQQAQAQQPQAPQQAQPGQYAPTQYGQPGDSNATTAFSKPATDPGANPQSEQH